MNAKWWGFIGGAVLIVSLLVRVLESGAGNLTVTFFDVGQGDAIWVRFPRGQNMLVDSPGGFGASNIGERTVLMELLRAAVLRLDWVVLTHPDWDHAGGLIPLLDRLPTRVFLYNRRFRSHSVVDRLRRSVLRRNGEFMEVHQEVREWIDGVLIRYLTPRLARARREKTNDHSIVVELTMKRCNFLFTGDIEQRAERALVARLGRTDLLKVAHHGSRTSTSAGWLARVNPIVAVISAGWRNRYGHPHPSVLNRLRDRDIATFRTDVDGFVEFSTDGKNLYCRNWHGDCGVFTCID